MDYEDSNRDHTNVEHTDTTKTSIGSGAQADSPTSLNEDYKVGYCCPPKTTQFRPGQSGNPKGRPRKKDQPTFWRRIESFYMDPVDIEIDGKMVTVSRLEAVLSIQFEQARQGNLRALQAVCANAKALRIWDKVWW